MNGQVVQLLRDLPQLWRELDRPRQLAAIGVGIVTAVALVVGLALLATSRPPYQVLFSGLQDQDAAAVVQKLREQKVPYELADGGATLRVPGNSVHDVRLQLASAGLPSGGRIGFEIFDRTQLGITDFAQRLNFQRGLEGELSRTIMSLSTVEQARVHLSLPEPSLFKQQEREPSASVTIKLRPGRSLTPQQVASVKHLVGSAVPGLKRDNVTVVDSVSGSTLEGEGAGEAAKDKVALTRQQAQAEYERALERRIVAMLEQALGPNKVAVKANVLLEWDQKETTREQFGQVVPRSTRDTREQFRGAGTEVPPAVGPPGTQSNIPSYPSGAPTGPTDYTRSDVTTNNEISRVQDKIQQAQGVPITQSTTVAVLVDQQALARAPGADDDAKVANLQNLVATAAGIPAADATARVSVAAMPFDDSRQRAEREAERMELFTNLIKVGALLLALAGLFVIFRFLVQSVRRQALLGIAEGQLPGEALAALPAPSAEELEAEIQARLAEREQQLLPQLEAEIRQTLEQQRQEEEAAVEVEHRRSRLARTQVIDLAKRNPEAIAGVVRGWATQE